MTTAPTPDAHPAPQSATAHTSDAVVETFHNALTTALAEALDAPTPAAERIQHLRNDVEALAATLDLMTLQNVKDALRGAEHEALACRRDELASVIREVAQQHGLQLSRPAKRSAATQATPKRSAEERRALLQRLVAVLQPHGKSGLDKASLGKATGLTANQLKRVLLWPETRERIRRIGHARHSRYVLIEPPAASTEPPPPHSETTDADSQSPATQPSSQTHPQ